VYVFSDRAGEPTELIVKWEAGGSAQWLLVAKPGVSNESEDEDCPTARAHRLIRDKLSEAAKMATSSRKRDDKEWSHTPIGQ
jgi:hypothetical protein